MPDDGTANEQVTDHLVHLSSAEVSVVVDVANGVPAVTYWGAPLGSAVLPAALLERSRPHGAVDVVAPLSLVPEHGSGFPGRPGLAGHRADGSGWAPRFAADAGRHSTPAMVVRGDDGRSVSVTTNDPVAGLTLQVELALGVQGVLRVRSVLTNTGTDAYELDRLSLTLPLAPHATEALTFGGRWTRELAVHRHGFTDESVLIENHRGRTSHDRVPAAFVGTPGFDATSGEVWGVHLAWSGNAQLLLDPGRDGRRSVSAGELLLPGEITLEPGASYATPHLYAAYSPAGTNGTAGAFHSLLRARDAHPKAPRPVTLNTWEAVYFDHDLPTLLALADAAASVGVERFVLDDGWFHGRRNDHAGLGDWWVDNDIWPDGLDPIIRHVTALGMQFGLWFEPEMVNPDSNLFREHPDWVLADPGYEPVLGRHQLVLDLARPEVADHLFAQIDTILRTYAISFVKWDMNRDLVHASHRGRAGVHEQTRALYSLMARVRAAHPSIEIESCSSGGGRTDFAILDSACRFWTSDCNDALERQHIQRGFALLFPPELMGAHIGPPRSHTTGRTQTLAFRAVTAFFGHLGVEWNLLSTTPDERSALADLIAFHKERRPLLHNGRALALDHPDRGIVAHGVVAADARELIFSVAQVATSEHLVPSPLRLTGLAPDLVYRIEVPPLVLLRSMTLGPAAVQPAWLTGSVTATGRQLATLGLPLPVLHPESALLVWARVVEESEQ